MDAQGKPPPPRTPAGQTLSLAARRAGNARIVRLGGEARLDEAEQLGQQLRRLIDPQTPHLLLELSELRFLSSAGIGALVSAHNRARQLNGTLRLIRPRPEVANLLRITRVDRLIPVHPTLAAAREALRQPPA